MNLESWGSSGSEYLRLSYAQCLGLCVEILKSLSIIVLHQKLIVEGASKLSSVPSGGGAIASSGAAATSGGAAAPAAEEKPEEKPEEKEESDEVRVWLSILVGLASGGKIALDELNIFVLTISFCLSYRIWASVFSIKYSVALW